MNLYRDEMRKVKSLIEDAEWVYSGTIPLNIRRELMDTVERLKNVYMMFDAAGKAAGHSEGDK